MASSLTPEMLVNGAALIVFVYCIVITMQREGAHRDTSLFARIMLGIVGGACFSAAVESVVLRNQPTFGALIVNSSIAAYGFVRVLWPSILPRLGGRAHG